MEGEAREEQSGQAGHEALSTSDRIGAYLAHKESSEALSRARAARIAVLSAEARAATREDLAARRAPD